MTVAVNIFNHTSVATFMLELLNAHPAKRDRKITLAQWARRLGYRSPRSIAMVLKGQRTPSDKLVARLVKDLKLGRREARYLEILRCMERQRNKDSMAVDPVLAQEAHVLQYLANSTAHLPLDTFALIAQWHHYAIKQLVERDDFSDDAEWIREQLRRKVTQAEIKQAITTMMHLGILGRDPITGEIVVSKQNISTSFDVPSSAIRSHHSQMMQRATEALNEQDVMHREMRSATMRLDTSRLAEAKAELKRFHEEFEARYSAKDPKHHAVYQCNIQFFEHTINEPSQLMTEVNHA